MAQVLENIPPSKTKRLGMQPQIWRCKNPDCSNLVSDVNQKTIPKEYCSNSCRDSFNRKKFNERHKQNICEYCHRLFIPKKKRTTRFCSLQCNWRNLRGIPIQKKCTNCKCLIKHSKNKQYCSTRCKWIHYHTTKLLELENA